MWEFWVPAIGMTAVAAAVLLMALRRGGAAEAGGEAADLRVYRDQLSEVDRDMARGVIAPDEGTRARAEVARRLLEADRTAAGAPVPPMSTGYGAAGLIVALMAASVGGYVWLGAPAYPDLPIAARLDRATAFYNARPAQDVAEAAAGIVGAVPTDAREAALLTQLRAAVAARPTDLQGHQLLTKSEIAVGNYPGARAAFQRAVDLMGAQATPQDRAELAELMVLAAGGIVTPQAEAELVACLKADPTNAVARYYSGVMLAQVGRPDKAFALWRPLLEQSAPQDPWYDPIRAGIEGMAQAAGVDYALPDAGGPDAGGPDAGGPDAGGPDAAALAEADQMTPAQREEMIRGMVDGLEQRLIGQDGTAAAGSAQDWAKLVNALGVLQQPERARKAFEAGQTALAGDDAGLAALRAAATAAGVAP